MAGVGVFQQRVVQHSKDEVTYDAECHAGVMRYGFGHRVAAIKMALKETMFVSCLCVYDCT